MASFATGLPDNGGLSALGTISVIRPTARKVSRKVSVKPAVGWAVFPFNRKESGHERTNWTQVRDVVVGSWRLRQQRRGSGWGTGRDRRGWNRRRGDGRGWHWRC